MLPTCIGISGVSRYRNDASSDDSFLASPMASSRANKRSDAIAASLDSGRLCMVRGRICNGKRPFTVKLAEVALALGQTIGHRPQRGRIDAEPDMTGEVDLDVLGGIRGTQAAGPPVDDAVATRID